MSGSNGAPNPAIDAAVAAVEAGPQTVTMRQWQVTISSTGRPGIVMLPADATDGEIAELCGWVLSQVLAAYRQGRAKPAGLIALPGGVHAVKRAGE